MKRPVVGLVVGLVVALAACAWPAVQILRFRSPEPSVVAAVGEPVVVGGVRYRVDRFDVGPEFPAAESDQPPVTAPAGAELVRVVFTEEVVDPGRDLETLFCDPTAYAVDGRTWSRTDLEYRLAMPEALTCSGASEAPVAVGRPFEVGVAFLVPVDAVVGLSFRLRLSTERRSVEFRR